MIGLGDVYLLDLDTDQFRQLTQTPQTEGVPLLAGDRLLWTVRTACDVVTIQVGETPTPLHTGVYAFDLNTDQVTTLTEYVEPAALFNGNAALIVEGCMVGFEAYVVPLD